MFRFLFQPFGFHSLVLRNRIICGPMEKNLCTEEGLVTERYADYVEERARGQAGLILLESAYVDRGGKARRYQMGLHDDKVIGPLRRLVDRAHRHGSAVGVQLHHGGRTCQERINGFQPIAPSPVACSVLAGGDMPREMTIGDIEEVIEGFRLAAMRSMEAGVDVLEIHGAHGYLVGQFLSPYTNRRTDEYGGDFSHRCRFPVEVIRAVRDAVGAGVPLFYRISADEFVDGGLTLEDTLPFAKVLEREGVDLIDVSAGIYESGFMIVQPMEFPLGGYVYMARAFKETVEVPVSIAGRICDAMQAETIVEQGHADLVTMTRAFHADPEFPRKALEGRFDDICLCIGCNQGCTDRLREDVPLTCILNTRAGYEREFCLRPAKRRKRVWVAGGGPAGLKAAAVCALRGHRVRLFERAAELGGLVRYLSRIEHKSDFGQGMRFLIRQAQKSGVNFELGVALDASMLRNDPPEEVILATGSHVGEFDVPGLDRFPCYPFVQAFDSPDSLGSRVLVYGGGMIGCETALYLAEQGRDVVVVEPGDELVKDLGPRAKWFLVRRLHDHPRMSVLVGFALEEQRDGIVVVRSSEKRMELAGMDALVNALLRLPEEGLRQQIETVGFAGHVTAVGDCFRPANVMEATHRATEVAHSI
jgi:2,4-dienoyl-CoA reductase-like NADH-dependent reductase (Old Yellow Enzyme family)/thioredoxin reductase